MPHSRRGYRILYFSANNWGNMGRRKPRLAHELAHQPEVTSLLCVEPPVPTSVLDVVRGRFEAGHLARNRGSHARALLGRLRQAEERLWVYTGSTKTIPLTRLKAIRRMGWLHRLNERLYYAGILRALRHLPGDRLIVWLSHSLHASALRAFPRRALACYDWTDDWAAFDVLPVEDPEEIVALNDRILQEADLVFAVSAELERRAMAVNPCTHRAPNATDLAVMSQAGEGGTVAPELSDLPHPIIGYIGQVADKMDYELIAYLARARPEWSLVFVGNVWINHQEQAAALAALPNVHFLGQRTYHELPAYLRGFDACVLPHVRNALTRSMDPIKLYDYLASGKPIVSTAVAGVDRFADVVYVGNAPREFLVALDQALVENGRLRGRRLAYARQNTWPQRAEEMWAVIQGQLQRSIS